MKENTSKMKDSHKLMSGNSTEKNMNRHEELTKKTVLKAKKEKAKKELTGLKNCSK